MSLHKTSVEPIMPHIWRQLQMLRFPDSAAATDPFRVQSDNVLLFDH